MCRALVEQQPCFFLVFLFSFSVCCCSAGSGNYVFPQEGCVGAVEESFALLL